MDSIDIDEATQSNLNDDIDKLKKALLNENNSPELLHYEHELIVDMLEQAQNQQDNIDSLVNEKNDELAKERYFTNGLYQMEIDRVKYLIASYLRKRLTKIEKYPLHILKNVEMQTRLSEKEAAYIRRYIDMLETHFNQSALLDLPEEFRSIDGDDMVDQPNLDTFVFCKSNCDIGVLQCDDRGLEVISVEKSDRHIIRYRVIRSLVENGSIELI